MRNPQFRIGCVASGWDTNEKMLNEAARLAGLANACRVIPLPLNGTASVNTVDAVLMMTKVDPNMLRFNKPVRTANIDGKHWAADVAIVEKAMRELITEAALKRLD